MSSASVRISTHFFSGLSAEYRFDVLVLEIEIIIIIQTLLKKYLVI